MSNTHFTKIFDILENINPTFNPEIKKDSLKDIIDRGEKLLKGESFQRKNLKTVENIPSSESLFVFCNSIELKKLMDDLKIPEKNFMLYVNPFNSSSSSILFNDIYDCELFEMCSHYKNDYFYLNRGKLIKLDLDYAFDNICTNIKNYDINTSYLVRNLIETNNFCKKENKKSFISNFETTAKDYLESLI